MVGQPRRPPTPLPADAGTVRRAGGAPLQWRVFSSGSKVWRNDAQRLARHYLPHFDSQDVIQFVTFRLADSLPAAKRFSARQANRQLGRTGPFWQTEYWDRFIRDERHFAATEDYIDQNPVKAGLAAAAALWPYGSARLKV
jgi:hypothetical protein